MTRANRTYVAGHYWHLTHRCHKKEFLLHSSIERKRWLYWLYQAKMRYSFTVLNYMVTRNHVHLIVKDMGEQEIARSMQLIAGRTAQEFNKRKNRRGAFWQDRYHATAIESGEHLRRCMVYIDMNMVRAGEVHHPENWNECGYQEIMDPVSRGGRIDINCLLGVLGFDSLTQLQTSYREWHGIDKISSKSERDPIWTESLAVGGLAFTGKLKNELGHGSNGRKRTLNDQGYSLK